MVAGSSPDAATPERGSGSTPTRPLLSEAPMSVHWRRSTGFRRSSRAPRERGSIAEGSSTAKTRARRSWRDAHSRASAAARRVPVGGPSLDGARRTATSIGPSRSRAARRPWPRRSCGRLAGRDPPQSDLGRPVRPRPLSASAQHPTCGRHVEKLERLMTSPRRTVRDADHRRTPGGRWRCRAVCSRQTKPAARSGSALMASRAATKLGDRAATRPVPAGADVHLWPVRTQHRRQRPAVAGPGPQPIARAATWPRLRPLDAEPPDAAVEAQTTRLAVHEAAYAPSGGTAIGIPNRRPGRVRRPR